MALGVVVFVLGLVADVASAGFVNGRVEEAVRANTEQSVGVHADVARLGWLPRLIARGRIRQAHVQVDELVARDIRFSDVTLDLEQVDVDRSKLVGGEVRIEGVGVARFGFSLTDAELSRLTKLDIAIEDGAVSVTVRGRTVTGKVSVSTERSLIIELGALPAVTLPLPRLDIAPCRPDVAAVNGELRFGCAISPIPREVLAIINR